MLVGRFFQPAARQLKHFVFSKSLICAKPGQIESCTYGMLSMQLEMNQIHFQRVSEVVHTVSIFHSPSMSFVLWLLHSIRILAFMVQLQEDAFGHRSRIQKSNNIHQKSNKIHKSNRLRMQ